MFEFIVESSVLIVLVILLRKIFTGKVNYRVLYGLWGIVVFRLLLPVTIVSAPISVMNLLQPAWTVQEDSSQSADSRFEQSQKEASDAVGEKKSETLSEGKANEDGKEMIKASEHSETASSQREEAVKRQSGKKVKTQNESNTTLFKAAGMLWAGGMFLCMSVMLWTNVALNRRLNRRRKRMEKRFLEQKRPAVFETREFSSPCLYGLFRPVIYLPEALVKTVSPEKIDQMVLHEKIHYHHLDHIWSFIRVVLVSVYWFHPLVWVAASLSKRDAELACDEAVMANLGEKSRSSYGAMLIEVAEANKQRGFLYSVTTMSRKGRSLEKRIRAISERRKYSWKLFIPLLVIVILVIGVTFTGMPGNSNATQGKQTEKKKEALSWQSSSDASNVANKDVSQKSDREAEDAPEEENEFQDYSKLLKHIKAVMPDAVVKELQKSGTYTALDSDTILVGNRQTDPTLRLDFVYKSGVLQQYRSKEYGFVDNLSEEKITMGEAEKLTQRFAKEFLGRNVTLVQVANYSGYDTGDYITYLDEQGGSYLVQLTHNMVVHYDSREEKRW